MICPRKQCVQANQEFCYRSDNHTNITTYPNETMRTFALAAAVTLLLQQSTAFVNNKPFPIVGSRSTAVSLSSLFAAEELKPEPEGGEVLTAIKTMEGSKMKNMGENPDVTSKDGQVYKFWLTAKVEGSLVKEIHGEVLKQSAKKANFPGFRKGQVVRSKIRHQP